MHRFLENIPLITTVTSNVNFVDKTIFEINIIILIDLNLFYLMKDQIVLKKYYVQHQYIYNFTTLCCVASRCVASRCVEVRRGALRCVALHYMLIAFIFTLL